MASAVQPSAINWTALIAAAIPALAQALRDFEANKPLATTTGAPSINIGALLTAAQTDLPIFAAKIKAYPGIIRGIDDLLAAAEAADVPEAADIKAAIDALPGGIAEAEAWLPTVVGMFTAFSPATGSPWLGNPRLP